LRFRSVPARLKLSSTVTCQPAPTIWSAAFTPRKPAPPVIKIRRPRRRVAAGAGARPALAETTAVLDRPDPPVDELVARVGAVIEVPYLKPIGPRRRRDRIGCRFVWPAKLDAAICDIAAKPRQVADAEAPSSLTAPPPSPAPTSPDRGTDTPVSAVPVLPTIIGGVAAAGGYVLGKLAAGGLAVFAASLPVGVALLVTFVTASIVLRSGGRSGSSARVITTIACAVALTAVVTASAATLRSA
jgi:hypothetical protein